MDDRPSAELRDKIARLVASGKTTSAQIEDLEDEAQQIEHLEELFDIMIDRVHDYAEMLIATPEKKLSSQQRLWLLAYAYAEDVAHSATDDAKKVFATTLLPVLYETA
jgi:hypothetical protein